MNIGDMLYFAPAIKFSDVDLDGLTLPDQLKQRISGFYIEPAFACIDRGEAFAAGVLLVSCIEAMARFSADAKGHSGERFRSFISENLPSLETEDVANRCYNEIRCGLVHEARLKNGAQFSLEIDTGIQESVDVLIVNPESLAAEVQDALDRYVCALESDEGKLQVLRNRLKKDLCKDFLASG